MNNVLIKSAIATAVIAATTATAIADTTLYGRLRVAAVCTDDGSTDDCGVENRSSRFGIKASHEISDGLTAFGKYEFGVNADEGVLGNNAANDKTTNRLSYVGVKGGFGEVSIGARWSPMYNHVTSPVDPNNYVGATWQDVGFATDFRKPDTLNYKNKFGPAAVHVQVQMADGDPGSDAVDEYQIGGSFDAGMANVGLAYQDTTDVGSVVGVHGDAKLGPVGIGVSYYNTSTDTGVSSINGKSEGDYVYGNLNYGFGNGMAIDLGIGSDMPDASGSPEPLVVALEFNHKLTKSFSWGAGVSSTDTDVAGDDDIVQYGAGMRFDF
jgi:predicted porin